MKLTTKNAPESPGEQYKKVILSNGETSVSGSWIFMASNPEAGYTHYLSTYFYQHAGLHSISALRGIDRHHNGTLRLKKEEHEFSTDVREMVLGQIKQP